MRTPEQHGIRGIPQIVGFAICIAVSIGATANAYAQAPEIQAPPECVYTTAESPVVRVIAEKNSNIVAEGLASISAVKLSEPAVVKVAESPAIVTAQALEDTPRNLEGLGIYSFRDAFSVPLNYDYNMPYEFYETVLPENMWELAREITSIEDNGLSSSFLLAIAATETGWGEYFSEKHNWFNFTPDMITYYPYNSDADVVAYTVNHFQNTFFNPDFYAARGRKVKASCITLEDVNSRYAFFSDGTVNWEWSNVIGSIMLDWDIQYRKWVSLQ